MTKLKLGVMAPLEEGPEATINKVKAFELPTCQVSCWQRNRLNAEMADRLAAAADKDGIEITTIWTGMEGPHIWDFVQGPVLIGLVPLETQAERVATLKEGCDFAVRVGVPSITTHVGFIPESLTNPLYPPLLDALREVAEYCGERDIQLWFETGQETPITLLRTIQDVGSANLVEEELDGHRCDVLLMCVPGWHKTPGYISRLLEITKPQVIIPIHFDDFTRPVRRSGHYRQLSFLRMKEFTERVRSAAPGASFRKPRPFQTMLI